MSLFATMYHIAETPAGYHVHRLDPLKIKARADALRTADPDLSEADAVAEAMGDYAEAIRDSLGFPPRMRWHHRAGWSSAISPGEPHPNMMAVALNRDPDDPTKVLVDDVPEPGPVPTVAAAEPTG